MTIPKTVFLVEDDKYGVQAVCATEELANKIVEQRWPHVSGAGACVIEMRLRRELKDFKGSCITWT